MKTAAIIFVVFAFSAAMCALNAALFVITGSPWSLFAAIFCGACALFNGALAVKS